MQFKIYQRLNQLLVAILASIVILVLLIVFNFSKIESQKTLIFLGFMLYTLGIYFLFKTLEVNWDKRKIQKMAIANQVVVANIRSSKAFMTIKDSSGKVYNLWEITVDFFDHNQNRHEAIFYDKLNVQQTSIPLGTVFMTYDENKPNDLLIIPNILISHIESLMPIVAEYEKNKSINIKYLNVYYKDGLVIETYKDSLKNSKAKGSEVA